MSSTAETTVAPEAAVSGSSATMTMPQLLDGLARTHSSSVAMQEKRYGIWQPTTWEQYRQRVRDFAHGLAEMGVQRGEIIAVLGDNRPEWLIAELAAQSLGASVVGIYPTSIGSELEHIISSANSRIVVAEDQEQVDKLLTLVEDHPEVGVERVIYYDPHGLEQYTEPLLLEFTTVEDRGVAWGNDHPGWLDEQVGAGSPSDTAVICTTSGTTSKPKLAELSHANLLSMAENLAAADPISNRDRYVSLLPFAWIGEQMLAVACGLAFGVTISFPEAASTQKSDMREIGPDFMFAPPRIWESMLTEVQVRIDESGPVKRSLFGWGYDVSDRVAALQTQGKKPGAWLKLLNLFANAVATRPVREQLGLTRLKRCYTGGAPLGPDVFRFFHAIGVNLKQIYGQTEITGIAVVHRNDAVKFETVGVPIESTEIDFGGNSEIMLRSPSVFKGYYQNAKATSEAITEEGWLHTGDAGYLDDDGQLVVIDRLKDVRTAPDGSLFSNAFIENKLKFSPYIEEAVVFVDDAPASPETGEASRGLSAIITLDPTTSGAWAEHERLSFTTYADLAAKPEVYHLIATEIATANADLSEGIRVGRFVLLHKQFDPDDDEITRTRKVRRNVVADRYAPVIEALANEEDSVTITSAVTYQDGSVVERPIPLRIFDLNTFTIPTGAKQRKVWSGRP
ncbi:AMP-binding protein [Garicola koreensis]|uniref:Acyl-CoA synthetase n=1 Tax=Garicola koreensis TaxID=1262554 RepID=A0A7W5XL11_9MICC|nr:AMP-binding protein [Garicola koreensis]MBB3668237.1 long-chain acyl-CoA synthetase [Garicola koreensis]